jgi:acyl carrier protein
VDRDEVLSIIHQTAAEFASFNGRAVIAADDNEDNLPIRYGFSSLDALEYLLVLEEKFGITLEDEDLTEEILSSGPQLADYIMKRTDA